MYMVYIYTVPFFTQKLYILYIYIDKIDEDDSITSLEFHEYSAQTGVKLNNQGEIRITIESQDEFFLPCEGYLTFEGQLQKVDGTAYGDKDVVTHTNNALMYLFNNIRYNLSGHGKMKVSITQVKGRVC